MVEDRYNMSHSNPRRRAVPHVRTSGLRLRAVSLVAACLALAGGTTFAKSGAAAPLDGAPDQAAAAVLHVARNQLGDPYV